MFIGRIIFGACFLAGNLLAQVPSSITIVAGNNQSANPNTPFAAPLTVKVTSSGGTPFVGTQVRFTATGPGQLSAISVTTGAGGLAEVFVLAGAVPGVLSVTASAGTLNVTFTLTVATPGLSLIATPDLLVFPASVGGGSPAAQSVTVTSSGAPLAVSVSATTNNGINWMSATPQSGTTPLRITVAVNPSGLAAGTYTGNIRALATGGSGSLAVIPVILQLSGSLLTTPCTINTSPPGLSVLVDGEVVTTPRTFNWAQNSSHTLDAPSLQVGGPTRSVFDLWSNGGTRSQTITVPSAAATFTAFFTTQHQLTAVANPANGGTLAASPASSDGFYAEGSQVRLTASAASNFTFSNFAGDLSGSANPQTVVMSGPRAVTANFSAVSANTRITISSNPIGLTVVVDGTSVTTPSAFDWVAGSTHRVDAPSPQGSTSTRYVFDRWSNNGARSQTITTPSAATTYTASFTTQHLLTTGANPSNGGSITASPASSDGFYAEGAQVRLTASAASNFTFANFSGDLSGSANPQVFNISGPMSVTANFTAVSVNTRVTISSSPIGRSIIVDGTGITAPRDFEWLPGSVHTVDVPTPQGSGASRLAFSRWSQGGDRQQSITTPGSATTYTAFFTTQHLLTSSVSPSDGGSLTAAPDSSDGFYDQGTAVRLTAAPASGFAFSGFSGDLSGTVNPQTITIGSPRTVSAAFTPLPQLTVTPLQLDLEATQGANATAELRVTGSTPQLIAVTVDQGWLRVNPSQGTSPFTISVAAVTAGLSPGTYTGAISVGGARTIPVNLRVTPPVENTRLVPDVPPTGIRFEVAVGAPAPKPVPILVNSSTGVSTSFNVNAIVPAGTPNWVDLSSRTGQTPSSISAGVRVTALSGPGTYLAQLQFQSNGAPDVLVPMALEYKASQPSRIEIDLLEVKLSSSGEIRKQSVIVKNTGTGVQPFTVDVETDDGRRWLTATPAGGSAVTDQPAVLQISAVAQGLPENTYTGRIRIQSAGQPTITVPVVFAVTTSKTLRAADIAMNWRVNRNYTEFPAQTLELVASGGTVNWQAKANVGWLDLNPSSGQTAPGTIGKLQVGLKLNQLQDGANKALITLDTDGANGQIPVQVEVQMYPGSQPVLRVEPAGMAFVAPALQSRDLAFTASKSGKISMSSTKPAWLKAEEVSTGLVSTNFHLLRVSIAREGLPPGDDENRGVITIQDPNGGFVNVSVLVYVPAGAFASTAGSNGKVAAANCPPSKLIPLFTSILPNFEQSGGAATSTEVVMIDDCGNAVASGVTGGVMDNRDPQLDLRSLGDGRYKATWSPSGSNSLVRLSVLGGNPDSGVGASAPVQAFTTIVGAATGPVLAKDRTFETEAGVRLPALAPGTRFRILGQNFVGADGVWPSVSIGGRGLTVVDASATRIVAVTPDDLPFNVEMQLVVQLGDASSIPEPVVIAPFWPALAEPVSAASDAIMLTGLTEASLPKLDIEGSRIRSVEPAGPGLWRVTLRGPLGSGSLFTTRQDARLTLIEPR